jgi:hypothetical protein
MAIGADYIAVDALTEVAVAGYFSNGPIRPCHYLVKFKEI